MPSSSTVTFQQALEIVEGLPDDQQGELIEIVRHRQREHRREALASSIEQAKAELARGEVRRGSVEDLMAEIAENDE
ncbi:MAG TPA: hypothetical protein VN851_26345 [Thermoanaerobaculia bacterium]|nr:hypothetical protein [Thermoanaerobaculia bacterium]